MRFNAKDIRNVFSTREKLVDAENRLIFDTFVVRATSTALGRSLVDSESLPRFQFAREFREKIFSKEKRATETFAKL